MTATITVGVLALQGGFAEHLALLRRAAKQLPKAIHTEFHFIEVRNKEKLAQCEALILPGGESTTMAIVAARLGLLEPLRQFVKVDRKPVWGTCAGLVMLAESASATKKGGQDLIGGLDIKVQRNSYGRQTDSFVADLDLPFLHSLDAGQHGDAATPFRGIFIRAPVVEEIGLDASNPAEQRSPVEIMGRVTRPAESRTEAELSGTSNERDIIAVRQQNVFGTSFHPELTDDTRIHIWWLTQVLQQVAPQTHVPIR